MRVLNCENVKKRIVTLAVLFTMVLFCGCGKKEFIPLEHLQDTMVTVNGTVLTLDDLGFYIQNTEATVQKQAYLYDQNDPGAYWRLHVNGRFVKEMVKDGIIDTAVHDTLFCQLAKQDGISLTAEEEEIVRTKAEEYYSELTTFQKEGLALDESDIVKAMEQIGLSEKYREYFCIEHSCEPEDAAVGGAAYSTFLASCEVQVEKAWDEVPVGHVTLWENSLEKG